MTPFVAAIQTDIDGRPQKMALHETTIGKMCSIANAARINAPILMDRQTFEPQAPGNAVTESVRAGDEPPDTLNHDEQNFYRWLLTREHGRLEQEFLPVGLVHEMLKGWVARQA